MSGTLIFLLLNAKLRSHDNKINNSGNGLDAREFQETYRVKMVFSNVFFGLYGILLCAIYKGFMAAFEHTHTLPSKFFSALQSYYPRLLIVLLSCDSRLTLIRRDQRKKSGRDETQWVQREFLIVSQ